MAFQSYLDNAERKTGVTPAEFVDLARAKGFDASTKATARSSRLPLRMNALNSASTVRLLPIGCRGRSRCAATILRRA